MIDDIILVDENDKQIGTSEKMAVHEAGKLHRAFSILIFNSGGELMLQKRVSEKYHCGGLWTNTCCSHPRPGESLVTATSRRLQEEMGFDCELKEIFSFVYKIRFANGLTENEFDHVFVGKYDGQPIINPSEVSDWRWVKMSDLIDDIHQNKADYTPWFCRIIDEYQKNCLMFDNLV
ncbi:MAG: isopentenyl-diphosphate Delta-isomerase [Candidatus Magasanikbacteria bacterium]|nr:isopentenyl-diphosphate Delta-isomerase [Candidatus Magasanikbacteria bacterium]